MPPAKQKPPPPKGCLWIEDAADYLGQSLSTLRKWRLTWDTYGRGPASFTVGRKVAYEIAVLDAWLDEQKRAGSAPNPELRPAEPRLPARPRRAKAA